MSEKLTQTSFDTIEVKCREGHPVTIPIFRNKFILGDNERLIDIKDETQKMLMDVLKDQDRNIVKLCETIIPIHKQNSFLQEKIRLLEKCSMNMGYQGCSNVKWVNKKMQDYNHESRPRYN